jgi:hypothetical protein
MSDPGRDGVFFSALRILEGMGCWDVTTAGICSVASADRFRGCFDISEREDASRA